MDDNIPVFLIAYLLLLTDINAVYQFQHLFSVNMQHKSYKFVTLSANRQNFDEKYAIIK